MDRFGVVDVDGLTQVPRAEWDRRIAAVAERQHGVVTHRQLRAIGLAASTIRTRVGRGWLLPMHRGVYALAYRPLQPWGHWLAAVLACGPGAVLSHASAAMAWAIRNSAAGVIDVTAPARTGKRRRVIRVHSAASLRPSSVDIVNGVPVTGVARTLIDLAGAVRESAAEYAIHQAQVKGLLDRPQLLDELAHAPNCAGTAAVRRILSLSPVAEDAVKSSLERRVLRVCKRAGLAAPEVNRWIALDGDGLEVDLCWPAHGLIVEVDSARFHDDERAARNDPNRDRRLVLAGWRVVRVHERDLDERPGEVIRQIRALLLSRPPQIAAAAPRLGT